MSNFGTNMSLRQSYIAMYSQIELKLVHSTVLDGVKKIKNLIF